MRVHSSVRHTHMAAATAADSTAADSTVHEAVLTWLFFLLLLPPWALVFFLFYSKDKTRGTTLGITGPGEGQQQLGGGFTGQEYHVQGVL